MKKEWVAKKELEEYTLISKKREYIILPPSQSVGGGAVPLACPRSLPLASTLADRLTGNCHLTIWPLGENVKKWAFPARILQKKNLPLHNCAIFRWDPDILSNHDCFLGGRSRRLTAVGREDKDARSMAHTGLLRRREAPVRVIEQFSVHRWFNLSKYDEVCKPPVRQ